MSARTLKSILFLLLALAAIFLARYLASPSGVAAVRPLRGPAVQAVYATGTVEPTVMLPIAPRNGARLMKLMADEGQAVTKGQVLAQLEDTDRRETIEELQARLDQAQKEYNRKSTLRQSGIVSAQALDLAAADKKAARAALDRATAELDFLKLYAPEDGRIIRRDGEAGEFIPTGQPVFWLECCAPLRISAEVDEEDISLVQPGQKVLIHADAFEGQVFNGVVQAITPKGDAVARSFRVRIGLEGATPLLNGMTAEANILIRESKEALLVPASAIKDGHAWVVAEGKLRRQKVETGARTFQAIEITQGLSEDSLIVRTPGPELADGAEVSTSVESWTLTP